MRFPKFVGGSSQSQTVIASAERTVNFYVEKGDTDALFPTPGFSSFSRTTQVGSRAIALCEGRLFALIGGKLFEFDANGNATDRGTVAVDARLGQLVYNGQQGRQLGVGSGGNFYNYDLVANTLTQVLTGECTVLSYAAGYGFAANINTGKVRLSNLNDFSTWDPGIFLQRSLFADPLQTAFTDANNLLWLIGTESFEVRYNSGVGLQPWVPLSGLVGGYGIVSPFAYCATGLGNAWLAQNKEGVGPVVFTRGGIPQAISSYALNTALSRYMRTSRVDDAEVMIYQANGHTFPNVSFPAAGATWTNDLENQSWAERGQWDSVAGRYQVWAPRVHAMAFGKHIVGDRTTGQLSWMDDQFATEVDGSPIVRERQAPGIIDEHKRHPIDQLELLMQTGVGTGPGTTYENPVAMLKVSQDGGETFGNERQASIGRQSIFRQRVYWTRLGAPAHAVMNVRFSAAVPIRIVDAYLNNMEQVS